MRLDMGIWAEPPLGSSASPCQPVWNQMHPPSPSYLLLVFFDVVSQLVLGLARARLAARVQYTRYGWYGAAPAGQKGYNVNFHGNVWGFSGLTRCVM